jgi:hypothetical protein
MILNIYKPIDGASEKWLERLNAMAESDKFLAGLGIRCREFKLDPIYPAVKDYSRAYYLMVSQDMWDQTQPTDEKYFVGVVEDSVNQFKYFEQDEQTRRFEIYSSSLTDFSTYIHDRTATAFKNNSIYDYVPDNFDGAPPARYLSDDVYGVFVNEIFSYILRMVLGSYFGGLDKWPVANHLLNCFETGGVPCGWIGPEFEEGGDPQKCMQVLHFGLR